MKKCFALLVFLLLLLSTNHLLAQCAVTGVTFSMNGNHSGVIVRGTTTNCSLVTVRFTNPELPDKSLAVAANAASTPFSIEFNAADGVTPVMLQNNFFCNSSNIKGVIICANDSNCGAGIRGTITCNDSCPAQVNLAVFNTANDSMNTAECLPPGNYVVKPVGQVPVTGNADYDWFINNTYQISTANPADGLAVTLTAGQSMNVALSGRPGICRINSNIDLNGCRCLAKDIELHLDSCNNQTGFIRAHLEAEAITNPNEILTASLTLFNSSNATVAHDEGSSALNDEDLFITISVELSTGTYTAELILTGATCSDTLLETFIINTDSCTISQPPADDGGNHTSVTPPPPPQNENQPGLDFCCVWMIINIILIIIALVLIVIAVCAPNQITISLAVAVGVLAFISFLAWLFLCSHWILIDQNFCDLLIQFMIILGWIEAVVAVAIVAAAIAFFAGMVEDLCVIIGLVGDLTYVGVILAICTLLGHYVFGCF